ncbi:MAG: hypothetical protein LBR44_11800 [Clostridiales Family XIII bacterium]|jgi:hypothetical protein|nr:hypothetical protein [Clostridiales Family XIII bacterium]
MRIEELRWWAEGTLEGKNLNTVDAYSDFCHEFLTFIENGLQAVIVSRNEPHYHFLQYRQDGNYNVTRPINSQLMYSLDEFDDARKRFDRALADIRGIGDDMETRMCVNRFVYTCQQAIGATLDSLPSGRSNTARKIVGTIFENYIRLILTKIGISVHNETLIVPVYAPRKKTSTCTMSFETDLVVTNAEDEIIARGSVKTTSKDRLDKAFMEKHFYNRLTKTETPYFAVFLNDVQRSGEEPNYRINSTFKTGHFKAYTIGINPLNGVYYCDIRPNMQTEEILKDHIKTLDHLFVEDIWAF